MKKLMTATKANSNPLADDPYGDNVLYLFRFNNDFEYLSGDGSVTTVGGTGSSFLPTAKFGSHSLYLGGNQYKTLYNPNAIMPGDFTLDFFYHWGASSVACPVISSDAYATGVGTINIFKNSAAQYLGGASIYNSGIAWASVTGGTFNYFSIRRVSGVMGLWYNGARIGNTVNKSGNLDLRTLYFNGWSSGWQRGSGQYWDSIRLTKGVARPVAVPTVEY